MRRIVMGMAATGVVALMTGCTGLEPAALSAGASVAQTGVTIFDRGKARTIERAGFDDSVAAVRRATANLSLAQTVEDLKPGRMRMSFHDERGESIVIVVERRTETVTLIQTDVGVLGEIGWATLTLRQVLAELAAAGSPPSPAVAPANQPRGTEVHTPPPLTPVPTAGETGTAG